jgi:hypothetical protein
LLPRFDKFASVPTRAQLRAAIFALLGDICVQCGFADKRALQIDHKHGGGCKERKRIGDYKVLKRVLEHPEEYQILCANCNWIKRAVNGE